MELLTYWKIIRKRLHVMLLLLCLAGLAAHYYIQQQPFLYRTTTTLFITPTVVGAVLPQQIVGSVAPLANNYTELMRTMSFAKLVAEDLKLGLTETEILEAINATYIYDTQIFRITVTFRNPQIAQALANATARMLIEANEERQRAQQEALRKAQRTPEKMAERARVVALETALHDELQYYDDLIKEVQAQIVALERGPQSETETQRVLTLREDLVTYRSERVSVLDSLVQTQSTLASMTEEPISDVDNAVVIEEAPLPLKPLPRDILQPILAALAAAIALGAGLVWLLDALDHTVKSPKELDALYGLPTQAAIGLTRNRRSSTGLHRSLVVINMPQSPLAEAFRSLRTGVRIAGSQTPIRSLLITSALSGEGKTFIAANLALSLAQEGKRVILVEIDLRRPTLHKLFALQPGPGLADLIIEPNYRASHLLQRTVLPNFQILTSGGPPSNPAELLGAQRTKAILAELSTLADIVLFDSPPATVVTDTLLIAPQVDAVLQVVRAGVARRDQIEHGKAILERAGARLIGPVLNCVQTVDLDYYTSAYNYKSVVRHPSAPLRQPGGPAGFDNQFFIQKPLNNGMPSANGVTDDKWSLKSHE